MDKDSKLVLWVFCMVICVVLASCGAQTTPPTGSGETVAPLMVSADPKPGELQLPPMEVLYEQWLQEAQKPDLEVDPQKLSVMAGLVGQYPEGYQMFYDLLSKPGAAPRMKMMAMISMTDYVFPEDAERLIEMTKEENDSTTRSCAVSLLCSIPNAPPGALERARELKSDTSQQVRISAILALASHGDDETRGQLLDVWKEKDLNTRQRATILMTLPDAAPGAYREVYLEALQIPDLLKQIRVNVIEELSLLDDPEVADQLEKFALTEGDADVKLMELGAAEGIRARMTAIPTGKFQS